MTSSAGFAHHSSSQSKRSWLMPSGRIATPRLAMIRLIAMPPRA
jgi:hypothetical protein